MPLWDALLCLLAVVALCAFFSAVCRVHSALAPLVALSFVVLWLTLFGVLGFLWPAGLLLYLLAGVGLALALWKKGLRAVCHALCTPGFLVFLGAGLFLLVYLAARGPVFLQWDEFSFWGTAAKLLAQDNTLYTTADIGWVWTGTQSPAVPLLSYFAGFFGRYTEWKVYWAIDLLLVAAGCTLLAFVPRRRWRLWVPVGTLVLLLPYIVNVQYRLVHMDTTYLSAYGDLPAGFWFGGTLCVYLAGRAGRCRPAWALVPLAAFALVKDNTFPIVLVAAVLLAADSLFFTKGRRRALLAAGAVAAPLAAYLVWQLHAGWANSLNPHTGGEATGVSVVAGVKSALAQLVGLEAKSERFAATLGDFRYAFFSSTDHPIGMLGSAFRLTVVVLLLLALAIWLRGGQRGRLALMGALSLGGMLAYQFMLVVSYGFLFKTEGIADWNRYQNSWFAGWLLLALGLLLPGLVRLAEEGGVKALAAQGGTFATAVAGVCLFASLVPAGLSLLGYPDLVYADQRRTAEYARQVADLAGEERVYFVGQGTDGRQWFEYSYYLLPTVLDYSMAGGATLPTDLAAAQLDSYLWENECYFVLVYAIDDGFAAGCGSLFSDGLLAAQYSRPVLYERGAGGLYYPVWAGGEVGLW